MKPLIILLLFFVPVSILAQPFNYEIKGRIKNFIPGEKLYFMHFGKTRYIDSTIINNGKFSFKGSAEISNEPEENYSQSVARLILSHDGANINFNVIYIHKYVPRDDKTVYLEPGVTEVIMTDSAYNAVVIPPRVTAGHYTLDSVYGVLFKKQNKAYAEAKKKFDNPGRRFRYTDSLNEIFRAEQKKDMWQFVKDHPKSPVSLYIIKHNEPDYVDYDTMAPYFEPLSANLKSTQFGKAYATKLAILKAVRLGCYGPDFAMNTPDERMVTLSSYKGKYVLVDFWASWCSPCRQENPNVVKAYEQFKKQNFDILGVSFDSKKEAWINAIEKDHLIWTQVSDLKEWDNAAGKLYGVAAIPQNFLIGPDGRIIAHNLFGDELIAKLKQLFGPLSNLK